MPVLAVTYPKMGKQLFMFPKSKGTKIYLHSHYKVFTQTSVEVWTPLVAHIKNMMKLLNIYLN
jgi:hypothetical protein